MESDVFGDDPDGTREAIMHATYRALCAHGYADLTIARIGEHFEKSASLIYHHYDGKDELLVDFLTFMLERFENELDVDDHGDARAQLRAALSSVRSGPLAAEQRDFTGALMELRVQATTDPAYREAFERTDRFFRERIAAVVRRGVEQGAFGDVDPERVADMVVTTIDGAMLRRVTTDEPIAPVLDELEAAVESRLLGEAETDT